MKFKNSLNNLDYIFILVLSFIVILTRLFFMENHLPIMTFIDSYIHLSRAIFFDTNSIFQSSYVYLLSILYPRDVAPTEALLFLRTIMILFSLQLIVFFYLILRKFFDPFFSTIGALFFIFLPMFNTYSTTLHDDIFALSMSITSLYFIIRSKNLISLSLALFFLILAVTARPDQIIFVIPFLISLSLYFSTKFGLKFPIVLSGIFISLFVLGFFVIQEIGRDFYFQTAFENPLEQFVWYLTIDNLSLVVKSIFSIVENDLINGSFVFTVFTGIVLVLVINRKKLGINYWLKTKNNEKNIIIIFLLLIFFSSIATLTTFHIGWTLDEEGKRIPADNILPRYLIGSRMILIFPLVFAFLIFTTKSYASIISLFRLNKKGGKHEF